MPEEAPARPEYNVFFSYSRKDAAAVKQIADALGENQIRVWLDTEELVPGRPWKASVAEALARSGSIAVFIGPGGVGAVENVELDIAVEEQVQRDCPLIPVFLPGASPDADLPSFVRFATRNTWVNFDRGADDPEALRRLIWGILGDKPQALRAGEARRPAPPPAATGLDAAVDKLARTLHKGDNVTFFIGPAANLGGADMPPTSDEMARVLLEEMSILRPADQPQPVVPIDLASSYYALLDASELEDRIVDLIQSRSRRVPALHRALVDLLAVVARRPAKRILNRPRQVIVTTNLDLMIERALLQGGISFTRVVQHCSLSQLDVNQYGVRREGDDLVLGDRRFAYDDVGTLDELIEGQDREVIELAPADREDGGQSLPMGPADRCILYKFHGSQDVRKSCALSTDHYFELAWRTVWKGYAPREVLNLIRNTRPLFLGYSFIDPGLRLISHTLLHDRNAELYPGFLVQSAPAEEEVTLSHRVERAIWEKIAAAGLGRGVSVIEGRGEELLERLAAELARRLRAGTG